MLCREDEMWSNMKKKEKTITFHIVQTTFHPLRIDLAACGDILNTFFKSDMTA
jgi:hypothetical protein